MHKLEFKSMENHFLTHLASLADLASAERRLAESEAAERRRAADGVQLRARLQSKSLKVFSAVQKQASFHLQQQKRYCFPSI